MLLHAQLIGLSHSNQVTLVTGRGDEPWEAAAAAECHRWADHVYIADRRRPAEAGPRLRRRAVLAGRWATSRVPWRNLWFCPPALQAEVDRALSELSFDVVAVEDSAMARVRLPPDLPVVLTDHEVVRAPEGAPSASGPAAKAPATGRSASPSRPSLGTTIRSRLLAADSRRAEHFQASIWDRYQRVQVFTPEEADAITRLAPHVASRVRVNPFGIEIPTACEPAREVQDSVLFVGNFTHPPNRDAAHWLAAEIMPLVWRERPAARLRLVGSDPPPDVMALASARIEVLANVPDTDPYLESAAVCVAPVRLGGGMRVKVLTALARGKAVVTTSRGAQGFARSEDEPAMLISDDASGLAAALVRVLGAPELRRALGERGRSLSAENHSPEAWAARLQRVYAEVVQTNSSVAEFAT